LERNFTQAYPTPAFSARLARDASSPFAARDATAAFLDANSGFDLLLTNIDAYAKKVPVNAEVRKTLLAAQRLAKLEPSYPVMSALRAGGIHSAQQIYQMGSDRFVEKYSKHEAIGPTTAAQIYSKAEQTYGVALALVSRFNLSFTAANPAAICAL